MGIEAKALVALLVVKGADMPAVLPTMRLAAHPTREDSDTTAVIASPPASLAAAQNAIPFAHPSEEEIARLLTFYGVRWEYEPRSFPLQWDEQGRPNQFFTPDFYLPDYDQYLEITTVKPSLQNRKNRKIRRLRELYPDVSVKLLAYKDVEALLLRAAGSRIETT